MKLAPLLTRKWPPKYIPFILLHRLLLFVKWEEKKKTQSCGREQLLSDYGELCSGKCLLELRSTHCALPCSPQTVSTPLVGIEVCPDSKHFEAYASPFKAVILQSSSLFQKYEHFKDAAAVLNHKFSLLLFKIRYLEITCQVHGLAHSSYMCACVCAFQCDVCVMPLLIIPVRVAFPL